MIKLLGCFKIVPDLELLAEEDWTADDSNRVDTSFVKTAWNCFDEGALEMMLKLSDQAESFGIDFQLDAVTVDGPRSENYLKTLYALGFEKAVRIECEEDLQFWPELTAGLITEYVSQTGGQDVVIMGRQSADGDNGKTPLLAAEQLGWPCITQVIGLDPVDDRHIKVVSMAEGGICTQVVACPAVLSVGDAPCSYLRVPTLKDRMKKGKRPIEVVTMEELGVKADFDDLIPATLLKELEPVHQTRAGVIIDGQTTQEKVHNLYHSYLKGRWQSK